MLLTKYDVKYHYFSTFNQLTGFYMRSGVIKDGKDTGIDPFMSSYPELIDVGIMGHCENGKKGLCLKAGVECYQDGPHSSKENMSVENFMKIAKESAGKTWQFALGGAGDPDLHENFEEILKICHFNGIVPNFTSSGIGFTEKTVELCKKYCGAVAISWYRNDYTLRAIDMLLKAGVKTNIHYVIGNNTIDEAIERLKNDDFPKGINAVIFLLHKPVGLGKQENVLKESEKLERFFKLVDAYECSFKIGFDSCSVPGLITYCRSYLPESVDTCEGARWSMYITPDMKALPCSFDQEMRWAYDISNDSIQHAWDSKQFEDFRSHFRNACPECKRSSSCMGGCPIKNEIVLCSRKKRNTQEQN